MDCCAKQNVRLPANITAGLTLRFAVDITDFPAPTWTAKLFLRGPKTIDLTATADGTKQSFTSDKATTAAWTAGLYWYSLRVTNGAESLEVGTGEIKILADLTAATDGYDGRSQNEIALVAINAVLSKRATQDQQRYIINNRELWRMQIKDLIYLQSFYKMAVAREKNKNSGRSAFGRAINVRFSN